MAIKGLSPPGTAKYSSNTLNVGDGTWDSSRNDFLLPNIMGLNFATMQYNGMGNRFRGLPEYRTIIIAHGTIAAITFLGIVPAAILIASFYHRNPHLALRLHISLQTITVLLTTVIFVLGYFAVGPKRSLTNPHHGIGLAIFVLVLFQAIFGCLIHRIEKGKARYHIPIKLMLHQWIGRATALLALAQIPIGLTLYGSPEYLFVLYALVMTIYLLLYFRLCYLNHKRMAAVYDNISQTELDAQSRHRFGLTSLAGAVAGGAGIAALSRRLSDRRQRAQESRVGATESAVSSRAGSGGSYYDEKYGPGPRARARELRDRVAEGVAGAAAFVGLKNWYDRRRRTEQYSDTDSYRPPLGGPANPSGVGSSEAYVNRMEEGYGRRPAPPATYGQTFAHDEHYRHVENLEAAQAAQASGGPRDVRFAPRSDVNGTERSYDSRDYKSRGVFERLSTGFGIGEWWRRKKDQKEQERVAEHRQAEESERMFGEVGTPARYTGDGSPRRTYNVSTATDSPQAQQSTFRGPMDRTESSTQLPPPRPFNLHPPPQNIPMPNIPPPGGAPLGPPPTRSVDLPPPQPPFGNVVEAPGPGPPPPADPPASGTFTARALANMTPSDSPDSRPVSVKVKMHPDGRHVTLRRLNEAEAAHERAARRGRDRGPAAASDSDLSSSSPRRYRRAAPAPAVAGWGPASTPSPHPATPQRQQHFASSPQPSGARSAGTPMLDPHGSGTDLSNAPFDENRRRRRAERARLTRRESEFE